jgi:3-deoxy-7-phosphoheptulonate synthase
VDGLVEVHPRPAEALSDGAQALLPGDLEELMARLPAVLAAVGREIWRPAARRRAVAR